LAASRTNQYERLAARVADLEAKISTLEAQRATPKSNAKAATDKAGELRQSGDQKGHKATPVAKAAKADVESHASHPAGVGMRAEATSAGFADNRSNQAQVFAQSKAMQTDQVHVLGGTSKPGGNVALIEFGGVKQRAAVGDTIAGLGLVTNIAISNGVTIVEINGVTYR
jgi:outer membrane murein-binding lipoprotein Lpp